MLQRAMAQAPKCKVCGSAHFGRAHVWGGPTPKPSATSPAAVKPASTPDARDKLITDLRAKVAELEAKLAARAGPKPFDRAAYMREWRAGVRRRAPKAGQ